MVGPSCRNPLQVRIHPQDNLADCLLRAFSPSGGPNLNHRANVKLLHRKTPLQVRLLSPQHAKLHGQRQRCVVDGVLSAYHVSWRVHRLHLHEAVQCYRDAAELEHSHLHQYWLESSQSNFAHGPTQ